MIAKQEDVITWSKNHNSIQERVEEVANIINDMHHGRSGELIMYEIINDTINAVVEVSYCNCCSAEHEEIPFPLRYLWTEGWEEEYKKERELRLEAKKKKEKEQREVRKKKKEEEKLIKEKQEYERLQEKFATN